MQYAYAFDQTGNCLEGHSGYEQAVPVESFQINYPGCLLYISETLLYPELAGDANLQYLKAEIQGGQVVGLYAAEGAPVQPITIYAHVNISGGDGDTPPGVELGSGALLNITAQVRAGLDPASPLIEALGGEWRITIRNQAGGPPDVVQVLVEAGQVVNRATHEPGVVYDPPEAIGVYAVDESDFTPLVIAGQTYVLKLASPAQFKVYRRL